AAVQESIEKPGRLAEQANLLLEIDIDAAEEDTTLADVGFIGSNGRVRRNEEGVVALCDESGHQRVIVHAAAAEHAGSAGGDVRNPHSDMITERLCGLTGRNLRRSAFPG